MWFDLGKNRKKILTLTNDSGRLPLVNKAVQNSFVDRSLLLRVPGVWNGSSYSRQVISYDNLSDMLKNTSTPCSKKVSHLISDNNFGKCGPIFKILSPVIRMKRKISTSPAVCCYTTL